VSHERTVESPPLIFPEYRGKQFNRLRLSYARNLTVDTVSIDPQVLVCINQGILVLKKLAKISVHWITRRKDVGGSPALFNHLGCCINDEGRQGTPQVSQDLLPISMRFCRIENVVCVQLMCGTFHLGHEVDSGKIIPCKERVVESTDRIQLGRNLLPRL